MQESPKTASFSLPSLLALAAAIGSFMTGAIWGFVLALIAIVLGLVGVAMAFSARVRGGIVSFLSLAAGFAGIIAALIKAIAWLT